MRKTQGTQRCTLIYADYAMSTIPIQCCFICYADLLFNAKVIGKLIDRDT